MVEKINAILMLEILGKPKEHINKVLSEIIESLGKEKDVRIINKTVAEPKKLEERGLEEEIFTSFAELEIETSLQMLMMIIFAYMPSHVDIIVPEELKIKNSDLNLFLNELVRRLHQYDELAKALIIEKQIIAQQIKEGREKIVKEKKRVKELQSIKRKVKKGKSRRK